MLAANQEVPQALQNLAMKDQKYRKGQTRQIKGTIQPPTGAKRRVRFYIHVFTHTQ